VPKKTTKPLKKYNPSKKVALLMKAKGFTNKLIVQCLPPGVGSCPVRADDPTAPAQITLTTPVATDPTQGNGTDLDNGWTATSPALGGANRRYPRAGGAGHRPSKPPGPGSTQPGPPPPTNPVVNGLPCGAPLPLLATGVPVCVINRYQDPQLTGMFNLQTGEA